MASIAQVANATGDTKIAIGVNKILQDFLVDITALRANQTLIQADLATVRTALNTALTKLNADAGVTDTNYAAAGALTSAAPTALTVTA